MTASSRLLLSGTAIVTAIVSFITTTVIDARVHAVDQFLLAHPAIANALIWEFPPPPPPGNKPTITPIKLPILWSKYQVTPYPSLYPGTGNAIFSSRLVDDVIQRTRGSWTDLIEGMDAGRIISTVPQRGGSETPINAKPGILIDFIPGGVKTSEYGAEIREWSLWPEWAKQQLRDRFDAYAQWAATACPLYADYAASNFTAKPGGFDAAFSSVIDYDPVPVLDPPINLQPDDPNVPGTPWAMVSSGAAFAVYVRLAAAQFALELGGCLPWTMTDYGPADLGLLFDGRISFRYVPAGPSNWGTMTATGHAVVGTVTPAPPLIVLGFLGQKGLIGTNRMDTLLRLFEWSRQNQKHVVGGTPSVNLGAGEFYMGYNGRAPVSRMINGTQMAGPLLFGGGAQFYDPAIINWVGGCGGASGFNAEVLKVINIAAERTFYFHQQNRFAIDGGDHVGTGHADDTYGQFNAPEIPTAGIVLDDATFQAWLVNENDPNQVAKNAMRRNADLWFQYLPHRLLELRCGDLYFEKPNELSNVYGAGFKLAYSVQEMEAMGLWTSIDAKLASLGGCPALGYPDPPPN